MEEFTNCTTEDVNGSLFSWNSLEASWNTTFSLNLEEFCENLSPGIHVLPKKSTFEDAETICRGLQAKIYSYQSSLNDSDLNTDLNDKAFKGKVEFWAGYTDIGTEGVFLSKDGLEMLDGINNELQWSWGEPNGQHIENCAVLHSLYSNLIVDKSCDSLAFVTCQFLSRPKFMFRGENILKLDPSEYFVLELGGNINTADNQLKSFYGSTIKPSSDKLTWVLQKKSTNLATQNSSKYFPVGSNMWKNLMDGKSYELNLNACTEDEFSCKDGTCVSKWSRCDKMFDCKDESDELNCDYVLFPSKYDSLTPPRNSKKRTMLNISIKIKKVLDINIESESFKLKLKFETHWIDGGLKFQNLQRNGTNVLEKDDWTRMWTPNYL